MYAGLLDKDGFEISGEGYHRVYICDIRFKISPSKHPANSFTFVNIDELNFPKAKSRWTDAHFVSLYYEADDPKQFHKIKLNVPSIDIKIGDAISFRPAKLCIEHRLREVHEPASG